VSKGYIYRPTITQDKSQFADLVDISIVPKQLFATFTEASLFIQFIIANQRGSNIEKPS